MKNNKEKNKIVVYQNSSGAIELRGDFKNETICANLNEIASLFGRDKSVISRHIKEIFKQGELIEKATVAKNATVQNGIDQKSNMQKMHIANLDKQVSLHSLISQDGFCHLKLLRNVINELTGSKMELVQN